MPGVRVFESSRGRISFQLRSARPGRMARRPVLVILPTGAYSNRVNIAIRVVPPVRKMRRGL